MKSMARAWPAAAGIDGRLLFLDLDTTGLFGGAGTQAFLVGCATIEGTSIRVRQFLLPGFEHERAVLGEFQSWAKAQGTLCTYNGRSFDVPLIEHAFHGTNRCRSLDGVPHLDTPHAARRWRQLAADHRHADSDDRAARWACSKSTSPGCIASATFPATRSPRGSSSSCAVAMRARSKR